MYRPPAKVLLSATVLLWIVIALFNTGIFVFDPETEDVLPQFFYALRWTLPYHSTWLVIAPSILFFAGKFPLNKKITFKNLTVHLVLALSMAFVSSIVHVFFISLRLDVGFESSNLIGNFLFYSADRLLIYFVILLGYYAIDYYRKQDEELFREVQLQEKINREKLNSFKNNIQPGFLLNTLHDIEELIPSQPALAERLIADLAQMILNMLQNSQRTIIRAEDDLQFLKTYIAILEVRLNRSIHIHTTVTVQSGETTHYPQPPFNRNAFLFEDHESGSRPVPKVRLQHSSKNGIHTNRSEKSSIPRKASNDRSEFAVSLFVIHIIENLLKQDKQIFRRVSDLFYDLVDRDNSTEINIRLKPLTPSAPDEDFERWMNHEGGELLTQPFRENVMESGSATLTYSGDSTLHLTIDVPVPVS